MCIVARTNGSLTDGSCVRGGYNLISVTEHKTAVRVRYAETDQMGVVYYANYYVWMEVARVEYCQAVGFRYRQMEIEDGIFLAVAESQCRYVSPARFDDHVVILTRVTDVSKRFVTFEYEMNVEGRRVATGKTRHIFLGRDLRPVRLPEKYLDLFPKIAEEN